MFLLTTALSVVTVWQLLVIFLFITIYFLTRKDKKMMLLYKKMPCDIPMLPIVGQSYVFLASRESRMRTIAMRGKETTSKGGVTGMWILNDLYIFVTDAVAAEHLSKNCLEKIDLTKYTQILFGNAAIYAPVPIWRARRKILAPNFNMKNLNSLVDVFSKHSSALTHNLQSFVGKEPVSIYQYLIKYTLPSMCETTMGVQLHDTDTFCQSIYKMYHLGVEQLINLSYLTVLLTLSSFLFSLTPFSRHFLSLKKSVFDFISEVIHEKRKLTQVMDNQNVKPRVFETAVECMAKESGKDGFTDLEIQEEIITLLLAGTDTTSISLSFSLVMLSKYPDVQEKVYQELQKVFGDSDRPVVVEDLPNLKYLEAVIKEILRMFPPAPLLPRKVQQDITLPCGTTILKGCNVIFNIYSLHRNPKYWGPDAEEFRPERFLEGPLKHPAAYMPFSYGPRNCLGFQYAYMFMKTVLSNILRRYRILPAPNPKTGEINTKEPLKLNFNNLVMKDADGFMIRLENRL